MNIGRRNGPARVAQNRQYEAHFDHLNDVRVEQAAASLPPQTLPQQAYGSQPLEWACAACTPQLHV